MQDDNLLEAIEAMAKAKEFGLSDQEWNELIRVITEVKSSDLSEERWGETKKVLVRLGLPDESIDEIRAILLSRCSSEGG